MLLARCVLDRLNKTRCGQMMPIPHKVGEANQDTHIHSAGRDTDDSEGNEATKWNKNLPFIFVVHNARDETGR